jgi:cyanophycin synthetase
MGHVIEHIALEIQTLAGMDTGFGRTRETKTLGPTMLFSVIPKRTLAFSPESAVAMPNP